MNEIKHITQGSNDAKASGLMPVAGVVRLIRGEPTITANNKYDKRNTSQHSQKDTEQPGIFTTYDQVDCPIGNIHAEGQFH